MSDLDDTTWFALHVRSGAEASAEARLHELEIETLLPLMSRKVRHARRVTVIKQPLFIGYLFARFCAAEMLRLVNYSHGVIRVLGNQQGPCALPISVIDSIRERIGADGCVRLNERRMAPGDLVRITEGPLSGWSGLFEQEMSDASRVAVLIETLQPQCRVVVRREALVPLEAS